MSGYVPQPLPPLDARVAALGEALGVTITVRDLTGWLRGNDGKFLVNPDRFSHKQQRVCVAGFAPACVANCRGAANAAFRSLPDAHVQTCWKQVREVVVPIVREGTLHGYLFAGSWRGAQVPARGAWTTAWLKLPVWDEVRARAIAAALALAADGLWHAAQQARSAEILSGDRSTVIRVFIRSHLRHASVRLALARHLGLSPSRTSHVVREVCGMSLQDVVSDERLRQAQRLLADSHDTVADIGTAVGWNDPPHFARLFRRLTGLSPARWRAEHRVA